MAGLQLERYGLAALTMKSIAEASNVSTKTLYNLFDSRDSLLLETATERLDHFAQSGSVLDAEAGIPRLLAYTEGTMRGFDHTPQYARAIISLVLRVELDHSTDHSRLRRVQQMAFTSLCVAAEQGELHPGLDLLEVSYLIAANQWGIALLWERGLLTLEQLEAQAILSHYLTLTPLCRGKRKKLMKAKLSELLTTSP